MRTHQVFFSLVMMGCSMPSGGMYGEGPGADPAAATDENPGAQPNGSLGVIRSSLYVSGTRLKARYVLGEDGSRRYLGHFDSARSEMCEFARTTDGYRCLPIRYKLPNSTTAGDLALSLQEIATAVVASASSGNFSDAGCTKPIYRDFTPSTVYEAVGSKRYPVTYLMFQVLDANLVPRVSKVFKTTWGSTPVYFGNSKSCSLQGTEEAFLPMAEVPLSSFARGAELTEP